jgi:hypothetical protein
MRCRGYLFKFVVLCSPHSPMVAAVGAPKPYPPWSVAEVYKAICVIMVSSLVDCEIGLCLIEDR